jgi:hypothetical protein
MIQPNYQFSATITIIAGPFMSNVDPEYFRLSRTGPGLVFTDTSISIIVGFLKLRFGFGYGMTYRKIV